MSLGLFLRLPSIYIRFENKKLHFLEEHTNILKIKKEVYIGKVGARIASSKIRKINNAIEEKGVVDLFLFSTEYKKLYCAKISKILDGLPKNSFLVPRYYNQIQNIHIGFIVTELYEIDSSILNKCTLESNQKNLFTTIMKCRTPCMLIQIPEEGK